MTKKFTVNCDFNGQMFPFTVYIGRAKAENHPLHFQAEWVSKNRGGMIPGDVMDAISQLRTLAQKNNVSLEELCVYALGTDDDEEKKEEDINPIEGNDSNQS